MFFCSVNTKLDPGHQQFLTGWQSIKAAILAVFISLGMRPIGPATLGAGRKVSPIGHLFTYKYQF
jgi:hypothetical protein